MKILGYKILQTQDRLPFWFCDIIVKNKSKVKWWKQRKQIVRGVQIESGGERTCFNFTVKTEKSLPKKCDKKTQNNFFPEIKLN